MRTVIRSNAARIYGLACCATIVMACHNGPSRGDPGFSAPIALRSVCGNEFVAVSRLRSAVSLRWVVPSTTEEGTLALEAPGPKSILKWAVFQTSPSESVRLYRGNELVASAENVHTACLERRPAIPESLGIPAYDMLRKASSRRDSAWVVAREYFYLVFKKEATAADARRVLAAYDATIVGGMSLGDVYDVRVPDPGPSMAAVDRLMESLVAEPTVRAAMPVVLRGIGPSQ